MTVEEVVERMIRTIEMDAKKTLKE
jgi:hypothetical protein